MCCAGVEERAASAPVGQCRSTMIIVRINAPGRASRYGRGYDHRLACRASCFSFAQRRVLLHCSDQGVTFRVPACDLRVRLLFGAAARECRRRQDQQQPLHYGIGTRRGLAVQLKPADCLICLPFPSTPAEQFNSRLMQWSVHIA